MQPQLGPFLRRLRKDSYLSQVKVAQRARIDRGTIGRWEQSAQAPRLVELQAFLNAVGATSQERHQAHVLLGKPNLAPSQGVTKAAKSTALHIPTMAVSIGPKPHGGDMLRALRMRGGALQEEVALRVGITVRTLRRWEQGDSWPDSQHLHLLCSVVGASEEEIVALTTAGIAFASPAVESSVIDLYQRCDELRFFFTEAGIPPSLRELGFFALEARAWSWAARSASGQRLLSYIYSCHANFYASSGRFKEGAVFAARALDVFPSGETPNQGYIMAVIISAVSAVYGPSRPNPLAGIEILSHWQDVPMWDDYHAWLLGDLATYLALSGYSDNSLLLTEQASVLAMRSGRSYEIYLRQLDKAEVLMHIGRPAQALALVEQDIGPAEPTHIVKFHLLAAQAHIALQSISQAQERLQRALHLILEWDLDHLRPHAQRLEIKC